MASKSNLKRQKGKGIMTQEVGESKQPPNVRPTSANLDELMKEALG